MLNLSYDIFFEDFADFTARAKDFRSNLFNHIITEGEEILRIGKGVAQEKIERLGRIETGRMLASPVSSYSVGDTYVELELGSEVFDNPRSMGVDYVPYQERGTATISPAHFMLDAGNKMEVLVKDLLDDIVLTVWNGSFVGNNNNGVPF